MERETVFMPSDELDELPDYTVSQPVNIPIGARWKIISDGHTYVGERISEGKCILRIPLTEVDFQQARQILNTAELKLTDRRVGYLPKHRRKSRGK